MINIFKTLSVLFHFTVGGHPLPGLLDSEFLMVDKFNELGIHTWRAEDIKGLSVSGKKLLFPKNKANGACYCLLSGGWMQHFLSPCYSTILGKNDANPTDSARQFVDKYLRLSVVGFLTRVTTPLKSITHIPKVIIIHDEGRMRTVSLVIGDFGNEPLWLEWQEVTMRQWSIQKFDDELNILELEIAG